MARKKHYYDVFDPVSGKTVRREVKRHGSSKTRKPYGSSKVKGASGRRR